MAKDVDSLLKSRDKRAEIQMKYGFIPTSIIEAEKGQFKATDPNVNERNYYDSEYFGECDRDHKLFGISGKGCRAGALSRFPQNIGRYLVKMYSDEGQTVLDPFAGHNSRMELVHKLNRNYIGYDISHDFMEANRKIAEELKGNTQTNLFGSGASITLFEDDSKNIMLDNPADFSFSSPPYWDLEWYGDESGQLGKCNTYELFIDNLGIILSKVYENIKDGSYCAWCINDFRKGGILYPYHASVITLFLKVGFKLHDIVITDLGYPIGAAFATQLEEQKRTAKRHEYIIIGKKF